MFTFLLKQLGNSKLAATWLFAHYADYDNIFNTVVKVKEKYNVHNSAIALRLMADLALQKLAELDTEHHGTEQSRQGDSRLPSA